MEETGIVCVPGSGFGRDPAPPICVLWSCRPKPSSTVQWSDSKSLWLDAIADCNPPSNTLKSHRAKRRYAVYWGHDDAQCLAHVCGFGLFKHPECAVSFGNRTRCQWILRKHHQQRNQSSARETSDTTDTGSDSPGYAMPPHHMWMFNTPRQPGPKRT